MTSILTHSREKRRSSYDAVDSSESVPDTGKRRRLKTNRFDFEFLDNEEQRLIQQALKISRKDVKRVEVDIPEAPTFYPTLEEFSDPVEYIKTIRKEGEKYGICKIVPPPEWKPTCQINLNNPNLFSTRTQPINRLQEGNGFDDGKKYTIAQYKQMADTFLKSWIEKHHKAEGIENITNDMLAKDYWNLVETNNQDVTVEYGNDIDTSKYGSGFYPRSFSQKNSSSKLKSPSSVPSNSPISVKNEKIDYTKENIHHPDYYATTNWNLNNLPSAPGTLLRYLKTPINGINVPWLYVGMLFSTFCWHTEDNYFYSINYSHFGSVKQWYGVPATDASKFERVSKDFLMGLFRETPDILHHMTTQISPSLLYANGVNVYKCSHEAGTFVITFPKSYHGGFSCGFNVGEAVNFALMDWLPLGGEALDKYRMYGRESVFSTQRLLFTILQNRNDFRGSCKTLGTEIKRVVQEEIASREYVLSQGVRDLRKMVQLQPNDFTCIDDKATDYDDLRNCCLCKQTCLFTAIACECDRDKVTCLRHFSLMCKCPNQKKFLLAWASDEDLNSYKETANNLR